MKRFKSNVTITFIYFWIELLFSLTPMLFIIFLVIEPSKWYNTFYTFPIVLVSILLMSVLLTPINLIAKIFMKFKVVLEKDYFVYKNINIYYKDVTRISFYTGTITKYGSSEACSLTIFNKNQLLCSMKHPPFILVILLKKRCKKAEFDFQNKRDFLVMFSIGVGVGILLSLFMLLE